MTNKFPKTTSYGEPYQICSRCVVDNDAPNTNLVLDAEGVCNNCHAYDNYAKKVFLSPQEQQVALEKTLQTIKKAGEGKEYDCILGISGGVDSTYLAYMAKQWGLRPLAVHFDNGWNSELAVSNIHNIVEKLGYDLHTYVIDWEEFKDLQLAYLKASVIDIEVPTDQFIYATLHEVAFKNNIKYILDGNNIATEFPGGAWKWSFSKLDMVNLQNIHKKFGTIPLKKFPRLGFYERYFYQAIYGLKSVPLLNYIPYNKKDVIRTISQELGWRDYGGKHYESIFTRFYQGYILPKKFGVDKRKIHLSNLIWSGQMTREEALKELEKPTYPLAMQKEDRAYVIKKFGLSEQEFEDIMQKPVVPHEFYGTENEGTDERQRKLFKRLMEFQIGRYLMWRFMKYRVA
jgi:N-acetyl sugar amidotransferase